MRFTSLFAALLAALPCITGCETSGAAGTAGFSPEFRPQLPGATATPTPAPTPAPYPRACPDLYDPDHLPVFELEMDPALWTQLEEEYFEEIETWHGPVTFRAGDEVRHDVMVRTRGNNSRCGSKIQVAIAFHKIDEDRRFHGVRRINLDHGGWGCKTVQERTALAWMREDLGLPAACANHARLEVNGTYYGLFTNIEHVDREFLERNFPDPDGNLYKSGWDKKTNESDPDHSDVAAFWAADTPDELAAVTDLDQAFLEWAAEAAIPARDNFWMYGWNYYLYNDPDRGFLFLPNDLDQALPTPGEVDFEPLPARVPPAEWLLDDPVARERWLDTLEEVHERFDADRFGERIDRIWAQVGAAAAEDPFLAWDAEDDRFAGLKARYHERRAFLGEWLQCTRDPDPAMDADGDGWTWCEECDDGDALTFPGAAEICGDGADNDCDGSTDEGCAPPPPPSAAE